MLRIYNVMLDMVARVARVIEHVERRDASLAKQMREALASVALNTVEVAPGKAWEEEA